MIFSKPSIQKFPSGQIESSLGISRLRPTNCFPLPEVPGVLCMDASGLRMLVHKFADGSLGNVLPLCPPPRNVSPQRIYRSVAIGSRVLAACLVNDAIQTLGSNLDPPPIEVVDLLTNKLALITRSNVRENGLSLGFYEVLSLSLARDDKRLAALERFHWMPWVAVELRRPIPPRLRLFEQTRDGVWEAVAKSPMPWQITRFLSAFDDTIVSVGKRSMHIHTTSKEGGALTPVGVIDIGALHPILSDSDTVTVEAADRSLSFAVISAGPSRDAVGSGGRVYFYTSLKDPSPRPLPEHLSPVSNILFINGTTIVYLSRPPGGIFYTITALSTQEHTYHTQKVPDLGFAPPTQNESHSSAVQGRFALLREKKLGLFWCKEPAKCLRLLSFPIKWMGLGGKPGPLSLYVWDLRG